MSDERSARGSMWRYARPVLDDGWDWAPAAWGNPADPLVYVSYGSVTARQPEFAPLYEATPGALADVPVRVLMTTGRGLNPAGLEPIPPRQPCRAVVAAGGRHG